MEPIETVCIIGAGFMGWQISLQCASHGFPVNLYDISPEALTKASETMAEELESRVEEQRISPEEKDAILNRILITKGRGGGRIQRRPGDRGDP